MLDTTEYMLTTVDNPFNPHTHFKEWYAYDTQLGYNTSSFLARVVHTSDDLPESLQRQAINDAIDQIVKENVLGLYKKIAKPASKSNSNSSAPSS